MSWVIYIWFHLEILHREYLNLQVKWIEQIEYDENLIPQLPELLISSRIGLGAKRWFTTLQRHCENISTLASINLDEIYPGDSSFFFLMFLKYVLKNG